MSPAPLIARGDGLQALIAEFNRCDRLSRLLAIVSPT